MTTKQKLINACYEHIDKISTRMWNYRKFASSGLTCELFNTNWLKLWTDLASMGRIRRDSERFSTVRYPYSKDVRKYEGGPSERKWCHGVVISHVILASQKEKCSRARLQWKTANISKQEENIALEQRQKISTKPIDFLPIASHFWSTSIFINCQRLPNEVKVKPGVLQAQGCFCLQAM